MLQLTSVGLKDGSRLQADNMAFMAFAQQLNQISIPGNSLVLVPGQWEAPFYLF
jgi:hypothetical protein